MIIFPAIDSSITKRIVFCLTILTTIIFSASPAFADSWRCGSRLISDGDFMADIKAICGQPSIVSGYQVDKSIQIYRKNPNSKNDNLKNAHDLRNGYELINEEHVTVPIIIWTYNPGENQFIRILTFEGDKLISIQVGDYGFDPHDRDQNIHIGESLDIVTLKYHWAPFEIAYNSPSSQDHVTHETDGDIMVVKTNSIIFPDQERIYDFGPDQFLQKLIFEGNQLKKIITLKTKGKHKQVKS